MEKELKVQRGGEGGTRKSPSLPSSFCMPTAQQPEAREKMGWGIARNSYIKPKGLLELATKNLVGGFPGGSDGKESACNSGEPGSIPGLSKSPGEGNGNPFQYSGLENSMDKGVWQAIVHRVAESDRAERLTLSLSQELWKPFLHSQLCFLIPSRFHRTKSCG